MTTSPEQLDLPLSIEPVEGWRGWRLARCDGALTLLSLTRSSAWPPREAMRSSCDDHPDGPAMRCRCGLYASSSPRTLARARVLSCGPAVVGDVAMWGRVVDHTAGTRSQFAYPQRVRLVCGPCVSAGRGGVAPVAVVDLHEELVPVCRRHRGEMAGEAGRPRGRASCWRRTRSTVEPVTGPLRSPVIRRHRRCRWWAGSSTRGSTSCTPTSRSGCDRGRHGRRRRGPGRDRLAGRGPDRAGPDVRPPSAAAPRRSALRRSHRSSLEGPS
jgi:hypothetical protein